MLPVAVLAGGLGTRMAGVTGPDTPKALLPVAGRPFIDFKLAGLAAEGVERVVLLLGHGDRLVADHVGSGAPYGLLVTCRSDGSALLGTGGAVRRGLDLLGDTFWVTYGDTYLRAPMTEIEAAFQAANAEGMMTVLRNRDRWDRSNTRVEKGLIVEHRKGAPPGTYEYIDYGLMILRREPLEALPAGSPFDLEHAFQPIIAEGRMAAFEVTPRFYEIGSPHGYRQTDRFLRTSREWERLAQRRVRTTPPGSAAIRMKVKAEDPILARTGRPAVFLDRDGVLVKVRMSGTSPRPPRSLDEVEVVEGADRALDRLKAAGFLTVVVTNQPDVARGAIDERVVQEIHGFLRSRLPLDAVYYCPHDNDDGCTCRKPKAGLILQAVAEWGIDLSRSCLIGDRWVDLGAAEAAGIDGVLLEAPTSWHPTSIGDPSGVGPPWFTGRTLAECVEFVLSSSRYR